MRTFFLFLTLFFFTLNLLAQNYYSDTNYDLAENNLGAAIYNDEVYIDCSYWSVDIPSSTWGISFGNSKNYNGLRFNFRDCDVETINGINFTMWEPKSVFDSEVNGISIGIIPQASRLNGINLGIGAVIAEESMSGLNFGLLAAVSSGNINGLNIGGLALVADGNMRWVNFGGLALVADGNITGLNFSLLAQVANGNISGINFGGLALVADGDITGLNFGGLAQVADGNIYGFNFAGLSLVSGENIGGINLSLIANVSQGSMSGLNFSGLALVASDRIQGINIGGLAIVSGMESIYGLSFTLGKIKNKESTYGISISGYKTETYDLYGANFTIAWTEIENLHGFSFAAYNRIYGKQTGVTIGLVNFAEILNGIQIGLINIVENNPAPFKILPLINAHF